MVKSSIGLLKAKRPTVGLKSEELKKKIIKQKFNNLCIFLRNSALHGVSRPVGRSSDAKLLQGSNLIVRYKLFSK